MHSEKFSFNLLKEDCSARLGIISTCRGNIDTPAFMPVGTQGTVKSTFIELGNSQNKSINNDLIKNASILAEAEGLSAHSLSLLKRRK